MGSVLGRMLELWASDEHQQPWSRILWKLGIIFFQKFNGFRVFSMVWVSFLKFLFSC